MKTEAELDAIITEICHDVAHKNNPAISIKRLRSIQIDALREAREIVDKAVAYYHSQPDNTELDDEVRAVALEKLDKLIRDLELK